MANKFLRTLICAWIAAGAGATATLAGAAAVTTGWDPVTSKGTALLTVGDICLTYTGFLKVNGFEDSSNGCTVSLVSATVTLVDTDPAETATFTLGPSSAIWGIDVVGGAVVGLDTFQIGPGVVGGDSALTGNWWIQWWDGVNSLEDGVGLLVNTVSLEHATCGDTPVLNGTPCSGVVSTAKTVTFTTTPEPGSVGLLLGALGAGWLARRRKGAA